MLQQGYCRRLVHSVIINIDSLTENISTTQTVDVLLLM